MLRKYAVSRGFRATIFGLITVTTAVAAAAGPAEAARHHRRHGPASGSGGGYNPPYAAIVVDANSGKVLHEANADGLRHPASLTKIMTLYLLFERLEAGKIKLNSPMPVSAHAAAQAPTKLGLKPGQTIEVEDAIRGLVTKSANDAAVVIAEALAGSEDDFAELMTKKARALGMSRTTYHNASGLPDDEQVTTARDQALLGRAIQERFPRYYRYFSTPSFTYRGETMRNHNHLLGRVDGIDGIKTGYTRASGFNLVTSVHRNNRHLVAVVLGGSSAGARDARMRSLIETYIASASPTRTATMVADAAEATEPRVTRSIAPAPRPTAAPAAQTASFALASISSTPAAPSQSHDAPVPPPRPAGASSDPIKPIAVKTIKVKLSSMRTASLTAPAIPMAATEDASAQSAAAPKMAPQAAEPAAPQQPAEAQPSVAQPARSNVPWPAPQTEPLKPAAWSTPAAAPTPQPPQVKEAAVTNDPAKEPTPHVQTHSGWIIQVGAFGAEEEAKQRLSAAQSKAKSLLSRADPFTEVVTKGDKTFYRARFAGLEKEQAEAACKYLKRNDIACLAVRN
jgi:D-alanyl-D-alanine carboxypeptidase